MSEEMGFRGTQISIIVMIIFFISLLANLVFSIVPVVDFIFEACMYVTFGLATFIGLLGIYRLGISNFVGRALLMLTISGLSILLNLIISDYNFYIKGVEIAFPSITDVFVLVYLISTILGIWFLLRIYSLQVNLWIIIETAVVFILSLIAQIYFIGSVDVASLGQGIDGVQYESLTNLFKYVFLIIDPILLTLAFLTLRLAGKRIFTGLFLYSTALILAVVADTLFLLEGLNNYTFSANISNQFFFISALVFTAGMYYTAISFISKEPKQGF